MLVTNWLTRLLRCLRRSGASASRRRPSRSGAAHSRLVDSLEPRVLLSAAPIGPEFQVNTSTTNSQVTNLLGQGRSVAMDADGDFVVTWSSNGQDGSGYGVYAQRYNAAGVAQGAEFRVNTATSNWQYNPSVAMDADGDFVITWTSINQDFDGSGVMARRYDASGTAVGSEFVVNTTSAGDQSDSNVAIDIYGNFVVTWSANAQDGSGWGIYGRRFAASGDALGAEFRINTTTANDQRNPSVAMDADGEFVVTWMSLEQDSNGWGIFGQRFNAAGIAQGAEFQVNTVSLNAQVSPNVAMDADGDFVITWSSDGQDGSAYGIFGQRYNAAGTAQGAEFQINTTTDSNQNRATVAMDADGDFVVTWQSLDQDGSTYGIYGQQFDASGVAQGTEFQVNTTTANHQLNAAVAIDPDGNFVVVWSSLEQDGSGYGVYAQQYEETTDTAGPMVLGVLEGARPIAEGTHLARFLTELTVQFSEDMDITGGSGGTHSVTNPANWIITRNSVDVSATISGITYGYNATTQTYEAVLTFSTPLADGAFQLTARDTLHAVGGTALDGDLNGTPGGDSTFDFSIAKVTESGSEFFVSDPATVNSFANLAGQAGSIARDADGDYVVVWDRNGTGIFAQRYSAAGVAQGGQIQVNTSTGGLHHLATVAMAADGDFVVTWTYEDQFGNPSQVNAQRFNAAGIAQGNEFQVNTTTVYQDGSSAVAMDADGDFVITWDSFGDIRGQRYNAQGVAQGAEFLVSTTAPGSQYTSTVAMSATGDFVVTWSNGTFTPLAFDIYAQRFSADGIAQGGEFLVNTTTAGEQAFSTVAMDVNGDFVIIWNTSNGDRLYGQRYNAAGVAQGAEMEIATNIVDPSAGPISAVAMDASGNFVVTWSYQGEIYSQLFDASGVAEGDAFLVNTTTEGFQNTPAVAMDASGNFVVDWLGPDQTTGQTGVFAQQYNQITDTAGPTAVRVLDGERQITEGTLLVSVVPTLTVVFSEDLKVTGGSSGSNSVTNTANWSLTRNGVDVSGTITGIGFGFNAATNKYEAVLSLSTPLEDGQFVLTARDSIQDLAGNALDGDFTGAPGGDYTMSFATANLPAAGGEFQVNTTTANQQITNTSGVGGSVAMDANGNYVVIWSSSDQDGGGFGVYGQRYNANGVAQGTEFQVNTTTLGNQRSATVAMDSDGDFVVVWTSSSQEAGDYGVYAQRYNAAGDAQGDEFRVNTTTSGNQGVPSVAIDAEGDFVVTWGSDGQDGSGYGIYAQRYDAAGVAQGGEFRVNTTIANSQVYSTVAMDADGDFVITWTSTSQDGDSNGIYAQRFNASGTAQGTEFRVNSTTANSQIYSTVAMNSSGDFVVTWTSYGQDGSASGIYAQRYSAAGVALGTEFRVNTTTQAVQRFSTVTMDADGDFVVTWESDQDGSSVDIYGQRYNASGVAQGTEFLVNTTTANSQFYASVASDAVGNFVVVWTSSGQDGSSYGVFGQRYESNLIPVLAASGSITFTENDSAAAIASGITISDPDTATLASAAVTMTNFVAGQDVLAFVNDGATMGNIAISTNTGGVLTLTSAGATATLAEWQAALRAVTYENTSDTPDTTQRSVEFIVNDGTNPSNTLTSTIDITATNDTPVLAEPGSITYTETDPSTGIASGITVSDLDSATLASATVTITNFVAGQDVLAFTNDGSTMGNIAIATNVGGVLTLTSAGATATLAEWQSALRAVTYENSSDNPDTTQRSVEFIVNDGTDPGNTLTSTVDITATNDAPILAEPGSVTYIENAPATVVASGITVSDLDSATFASATVTMTNFVVGQDVLAFTNDGSTMGNIAIATNVGGVLTLTSAGATATLAEWQAALRAVTYENTSDTPDTTQRSVEFVVNDGTDPSNTLTSTVDITATNEAPILADLETTALSYVPGGAATVVTSTLTVTDPDTADLSGAVIQITGGYQAGDVLGFVNTSNITGIFNAGTGTLTLTGTDSVASYQAALRSVTYVSSSTNAAPRTVSFEVSDGTDPSHSVSRIVGGYAQLSGGTVNVYGTPLVDVITVTDSGALQFVVNGLVTEFDPSQVSAINIFAYGGNDTVQVNSLTSGKTVTVYGGGGNDTLRVDSSVASGVQLNGGNGNDLLVGGSGNDVLIGGVGNDWLNGGDGSDALDGGTGNDVYAFRDATGNQTDTVVELAEGGTDLLNFSAITTAVLVDLTNDTTLAMTSQRVVKVGSSGQSANMENVFGGSEADVITGNAAKNDLYGNGGNDTLNGGDGNDYLNGGEGNDLLKGGAQDDVLIGGVGSDFLLSESGNDRLIGGDGANVLDGGQGDDLYLFTPATINQIDTVVELTDGGIDTLDFSALTTTVVVTLTSDTSLATMAQRIVKAGAAGQSANFENAIGGSGNDQISGNAANNLLVGHGGNDTISGGVGNDILLGGQGNDVLKGIGGRNLLIGGTGGDLLQGGTDGDLLLSGVSSYESDPAILQALLSEWASANTYPSRVDHLLGNSGGGANTSFTLSSSTVANDADKDYLTGSEDQDWFLASSLQDVLTDKAANELFTQIDAWI